MQSEFRSALVFLCRRILYPLVRILVRFGISAGEFKSIVDAVYARAGLEYLERAGGRATNSRLAVITGINRTALAAILSAPQGDDFEPRSGTQLHRAARVLNGWYDDVDFQTRSGGPAVLPILGARVSFQQLAQRYSGGVYHQTILAELERTGAVKRTGSSKVRAVRRSLGTGGASADSLRAAGEVAGDLMATLEHNLASAAHEQLPVRALALRADARGLPLFRAQVGRRADALIEQIESFLEAHRAERGREGSGEGAKEELSLGAAVFAVCRDERHPERHAGPPKTR